MADNYDTTPATPGGLRFASDEDAGPVPAVHYPLIKLAWGPLDTFNIIEDAAGKRLPVVIGAPVSTKTDLAPAVPTNAVVSTVSAQAVAANGARKGLHLRNTSTAGQRISLSMNGAATLDDGITLYPQDVFEMGEYDFDQGAVNAIASSASARLSVQEFA